MAGLLLNNISSQLQILRGMGRSSEAKEYLKKYLQLTEGKEDKSSTLHAYCNKATVFYDEGKLDKAYSQLSEAERLALQLNDQNQLAWVLDMQGLVLHEQGKPDIAMQLYGKALSLSKDIGDKDIYQKCLGHMAWIVSESGDNHRALEMFHQQEKICSEIDNVAALSFSFSGQSVIYRLLDMRKEALQSLVKQEAILLQLNNRKRMLDCLNNQNVLHQQLGDTPASLICIEKQLVICRDLGNPQKVQELEELKLLFEHRLSSAMPSMGTRGGMESKNPAGSDFDEHQLNLEAERQAEFFLSSGDFGAYFDYLVDKANAFALKRSDLILTLFFNFEAACHREEQWGYVQKSMNVRAEIQGVRGNTSQAITLWEGAFAFAESRDDDVGMCDALVGMASNLKSKGDMHAAHEKYDAAEEIARKSGNHRSLVFICNNNANILNKMGNHQDAVVLLRKALASAHGLQDYESMVHIGRNLGDSLIKMGQHDEGLEAYRESIQMSRKHKDTSGLVSDLIWVVNEILRSTPDQWEIAESYLQEAHRLQAGLGGDDTANEEIKRLTIKLQEFSHVSNTEKVSIPFDSHYSVWRSSNIAREVLQYEDGNILIKEVPTRPIRDDIKDVIKTYIQQLQSGILQQMLSSASCLGDLNTDAADSIPYLLDIACNTFLWQIDANQFNPNAMYANPTPSPGAVAAEALMKIGEPAVPALTDVANDSEIDDVDRGKARLILNMISKVRD
ncbi:MAG: tetratricopeptide repeat protein [Bacteroidales bacterium]|nr:tetratricopeptide repeat protein [Bacteroidales bacterium]